MARGKTKEQATIAPRKAEALELRKAGYSFRKIAERLQISVGQAFKDVNNELKELAAQRLDSAEELRELELERLDMWLAALDPMVQVGNEGSIRTAVKIAERRAKLLGLDAPAKTDITTGGDKIQAPVIFLPQIDHDRDGD